MQLPPASLCRESKAKCSSVSALDAKGRGENKIASGERERGRKGRRERGRGEKEGGREGEREGERGGREEGERDEWSSHTTK